MKKCKFCEDTKSESEFTFRDKTKGIYGDKCKSCQREYSRQHYEANKEKRKQQSADYRAKNKQDKTPKAKIDKTHKICKGCGLNKKLDTFPKNTRNGKLIGDGTKGKCKDCTNLYHREYLKDTSKKQAHIKRVEKNRKEHAYNLQTSKVETGCQICGYSKCARSLQYHHIDPSTKEFGISWAMKRRYSMERLAPELEKCILVCANCHGEIEEGLVEIGSDAKG